MKKLGIIFLFFVFLFLGMLLGKSTDNIKNNNLNEEIKDFEGEIVLPDNEYDGISAKEVEPNIFGKVGEKIEGGIDKAFDIAKDVLKKIIG